MFEIFKTVLLQSALGAVVTLLLLVLKPVTVRWFSAKWQYYIWLIATVCMLAPVWRVIPERAPAAYEQTEQTEQTDTPKDTSDSTPEAVIMDTAPMEYREIPIGRTRRIRIYDLAAYVWLAGMCVYLGAALISYFRFLAKKKRGSVELSEHSVFDGVKRNLKIRRRIKLRVAADSASPVLVGTFFPVVYISGNGMDEATEKLVFTHELTHYKHGDLIYKWITLIVNAVHWFNPFAYLLSANVSEACEVYCDMSVVRDMNDEEKDMYMETILNLAERREKECLKNFTPQE